MKHGWCESKYGSSEDPSTSDDEYPSQAVQPRVVIVKHRGVTEHSTAAEVRASFDARDWGEQGAQQWCLVSGCPHKFRARGEQRDTRLRRQLRGLMGHCVGFKDDAHQHLAAELEAQSLVPAAQYSETQWVAWITHCRGLRQRHPWSLSTQDTKTLQVYQEKLQRGCFKASDAYYRAWDEADEL
jgi:hypothetical protein